MRRTTTIMLALCAAATLGGLVSPRPATAAPGCRALTVEDLGVREGEARFGQRWVASVRAGVRVPWGLPDVVTTCRELGYCPGLSADLTPVVPPDGISSWPPRSRLEWRGRCWRLPRRRRSGFLERMAVCPDRRDPLHLRVSARVSAYAPGAVPVWRLHIDNDDGECADVRCDLQAETCSPNGGVCEGPPTESYVPCSLCRTNDPTFEVCAPEPTCTCAGGSCSGASGDQSACVASADSSGGAAFKCCGGSSCAFDFSGSGGACTTCGAGSTCDLHVTGSGGAAVDCRSARECTVRMQGSGDCRVACGPDCVVDGFCEVTCPDGPPRTCTGGGQGCGDRCVPPPPAVSRQVESFDSASGWSTSSNGTATVGIETVDMQEGAAALRWRHTINADLGKSFAGPQDLSAAQELRLWIKANRTVGSACCAFRMRLHSSNGWFERQILPDVQPGAWYEDVSERDSWFPSSVGAPDWSDIRAISFVFYGDDSRTEILFDDLRAVTSSVAVPTVRASATRAAGEAPAARYFAWANPLAATVPDGQAATVTLEDRGFGFVWSAWLNLTGFGFSVPSAAIIRGIRVEARMKQTGILVWDGDLRLMKDGVRVGDGRAYGDALPDEFAYRYYGGPSDLWGTSWTAADLNAPGFGVAAQMMTHTTPATALVDDVRVGVYYDMP